MSDYDKRFLEITKLIEHYPDVENALFDHDEDWKKSNGYVRISNSICYKMWGCLEGEGSENDFKRQESERFRMDC